MSEVRFTFTRSKLDNLRLPKKGRVYYYDDAMRSLTLCVSNTGAKSFRVYRKLNGRPLRRTLGMFDPDLPDSRELPDGTKPLDLLGNNASLNVQMARKLATAVNAAFDAGIDPGTEQRASRKALSLGELFTHYQRHLTAEGKKSVAPLTQVFERYLGDLPDTPRKKHGQERTKAQGAVNWQRRAISTITPADVSRLRLSLSEHIGKTTSNRVIELLRAMYNFAKKKAKPPLYTGENPAAGIAKFDRNERERFVQSHEATRFVEALDSEIDADFRDYVMLSICAGSRRKNLLRMRWDEISLDGATWTLAGEKMKNGQPLVIPLVPDAVDILRRRAAKVQNEENRSEWVFPGGTPAGHIGPPRKKWAKFLKRAKLTDLHLHDLRRTLGSWMTNKGASLQLTMRALGHRSVDAAMIYQRLEIDPVRDAMQCGITGFFDAAKAGAKAKVVEMPPRRIRKKARRNSRLYAR
jgi:integrase